MFFLWALSSVYISPLWGITAPVFSSIHFGTTSPALHWLLLLWAYQVQPADYTFLKSTDGILELPSISCRIYHYVQHISILDISLRLLTSLSISLLNITPWKSNMQLNLLPSKQNSQSFPSTVCHTHFFHYFNFWKSHLSSCSCQNTLDSSFCNTSCLIYLEIILFLSSDQIQNMITSSTSIAITFAKSTSSLFYHNTIKY